MPAAAVHGDTNIQPPKSGKLYTAEDWNTTSTPEKEPYFVSKVFAVRDRTDRLILVWHIQGMIVPHVTIARLADWLFSSGAPCYVRRMSCVSLLICRQRQRRRRMNLPRRRASRLWPSCPTS